MLLDKGLQFEGDKLIGADDVVNPFKESHPDAFQSTKPTPTFVAATGTSQEMKLTKEDFRKKWDIRIDYLLSLKIPNFIMN